MSATLVRVTADVSRADAVERVARVADRVRDMERDLRHARTRLALVVADAVDQHAAPIGSVASAAGIDHDEVCAITRQRTGKRPIDTAARV